MQCPRCRVDLLISIREGIEIDCCPNCGGIWLDHFELMQIIAQYLHHRETMEMHDREAETSDKVHSG